MLDAAARALPNAVATIMGRNPRMPVLRGVDGRALFTRAEAVPAIAAAVSRTVRWGACIDEAIERGAVATLELPPGSALTRMMAQRPALQARAVADFRSAEGVARWMERLA
jgi:[acyl-carrier-protein] S-malonyltransferase